MKVTIRGKELELKHTFKAELIFETAENHTFNGASTKDWITMFYCTVLSSNKDDDAWIKFADFIDWLDEGDNGVFLYDFITSYTEHAVALNELRKAKEDSSSKPKNVKGAKR
jgi:hypothetical protein